LKGNIKQRLRIMQQNCQGSSREGMEEPALLAQPNRTQTHGYHHNDRMVASSAPARKA
jgi:hypothetical protein